MTTDTNLVYTRTVQERIDVRRTCTVITTRHQIARIDARTGQPDLTTRTMVETISVRPLPDNLWVRGAAA